MTFNIGIHQKDCLVGMAAMGDGSVDVVVTSPPYNLGISYKSYDDTTPRQNYLAWLERWAGAVKRVLSPNGSLFLNLGGKPSDPWLPLQAPKRVAGIQRFQLQNVIHWIKSITVEDESSGHYKPINSPRFLNDCHEPIFHFTKTGKVPLDRLALGVPYQDKSNLKRGTRGKNGDLRCRGNNWFIPYETIQRRASERPHPATFPVQLAEWCIKLHGVDRCHTVMDPFLGIGSSAVAAANLGMDFVGFEIDEEYVETAKARVLAVS